MERSEGERRAAKRPKTSPRRSESDPAMGPKRSVTGMSKGPPEHTVPGALFVGHQIKVLPQAKP